MDKPNILLLTIDALRSDTMSSFGGSGEHTPNLDRIAGQSIRFTQAITGGSWTQAAFPVILTSSYAGQYGGCMGPLSPSRPSPISSLAEHGYDTFGISSNPWLSRKRAYDRGFRVFNDLYPYRNRIRIRRMRGGQNLLRSPAFQWLAMKTGRRLLPPNVYVKADKINQTILQALENRGSPFFLWAHYMDTHWPYHIPDDLSSPGEIARAWRDIARFHSESWFGKKTSAAQLARYKALYHRALKYLDRQVGSLLEAMEAAGHMDNTVLIVLADHGEEFLDHGRLGHLEINFHDEIARVPFFIMFPGGGRSREISCQVSLLDVMPTILSLGQVPAPAGLMGHDLAPLWQGYPDRYPGKPAICERPRPTDRMISLRTERFKYIWHQKDPQNARLFDLAADPEERHNRIADFPDEAAVFHGQVIEHLERIRESAEESRTIEGDILEERLRDLGYLP